MVGRSRSPWRVVVGGSSRSRTAALCVRRRPGDRAWATRVWIRIPRGAIRVARARRGRKVSRERTLGRGAAAGGRQRAEPAVWVGVAFGPEGRTAGPPRRGCCSRRRRVDAALRARARRAPSRASRQRPVNRSRGLGRSPPHTPEVSSELSETPRRGRHARDRQPARDVPHRPRSRVRCERLRDPDTHWGAPGASRVWGPLEPQR